jgi:FMN phosphatase YigB (HAD superfamily)
MAKKIKTIAFDLGGVVFLTNNDTNIFSENYLETPLNPDILHLIDELRKDKNNKLIIISKAFPNNARKSKEILKMYRIDDYFNSIIFCERKEDKAKIAEAMRVDIMIDDREDVLQNFPESIRTILYKQGDDIRII